MTPSHGKLTVILINPSGPQVSGASDISEFCNTSELPETADTEDLTTYGKNKKVYGGSLQDATFTMGGVYGVGASGTPRTLLQGKTGQEMWIWRRLEGTGSNKPQEFLKGILSSFNPSSPAGGHVMWTSEFQTSDEIDYTDQT